MKHIILLIILISILISPYIYKKYIARRFKDIDKTRKYIYKHFIDLYVYLPSKNMMTYNLSYETSINYWINYCYQEQRKHESV